MMGRLGLSRQRVAPDSGNVFGPAARQEGGPLRWGRLPVVALAATATVLASSTVVAGVRRIRRGA
jgi:hypothetical protein